MSWLRDWVLRPDGTDSYFPTRRMPIGMLQYMIQFFNAKAGQRVSISISKSA